MVSGVIPSLAAMALRCSGSAAEPAPLSSLCSQMTPAPSGGGPSPLVSKVPVGGTCIFTLRTTDGGCGYFVLTSKLARAGNEGARGGSELPSAGRRRRRTKR